MHPIITKNVQPKNDRETDHEHDQEPDRIQGKQGVDSDRAGQRYDDVHD